MVVLRLQLKFSELLFKRILFANLFFNIVILFFLFFTFSFLFLLIYFYCYFWQDELHKTAEVWNADVTSPSKNANVPHGRPNVMYSVPELYNTQNYTQGILQEDLEECKEECIYRESIPCDVDIFRLCTFIMAERGLSLAKDAYSGLDLYLVLREILAVLND